MEDQKKNSDNTTYSTTTTTTASDCSDCSNSCYNHHYHRQQHHHQHNNKNTDKNINYNTHITNHSPTTKKPPPPPTTTGTNFQNKSNGHNGRRKTTTTITRTTMKGNDGRGARKILLRKLSIVMSSFVCFIGTLHLMGFGRFSSSSSPSSSSSLLSSSLKQQLDGNTSSNNRRTALRKFAKSVKKQRLEKKKQQDTAMSLLSFQGRRALPGEQISQPIRDMMGGYTVIDVTVPKDINVGDMIHHPSNKNNNNDNNDGSGMFGGIFGNQEASKKKNLEIIQKILNGSLHLVDIMIKDTYKFQNGVDQNSYAGISGSFCQVNFQIHKENPAEVPMFRDLVSKSSSCQTHYRVDLKAITELTRKYDEQILIMNQEREQEQMVVPKVLRLSGVAFHESRCGSTLVANSLIKMDPQRHRVYSESAPPIAALKVLCGENYIDCGGSSYISVQILKDTIYMMSRSDDPKEERVFFKIQSIGSIYIESFRMAFPSTPWIFVYREPVQVMMSHFKKGKRHANCLRFRHSPTLRIKDAAHQAGFDDMLDLSPYEFCAAHLEAIQYSAWENIIDSKITTRTTSGNDPPSRLGIPVNYEDLPNILYQYVIPNHFHVPVNQEQIDNIIKVSSVYSKGRYTKTAQAQPWESDSQVKEDLAQPEAIEAADRIMGPTYRQLKTISLEHYQQYQNNDNDNDNGIPSSKSSTSNNNNNNNNDQQQQQQYE